MIAQQVKQDIPESEKEDQESDDNNELSPVDNTKP